MKHERVVVVGAGAIADAWFPPLLAEELDIAAVVDINPDAAKRRIAKYQLNCEASTDLRATLRRTRPDFVLDLTVPDAHCAVTCTALRAGCHVIGEKPMATTLAQARRMVRTAEETRKLYMVSQSRRWDASHETVRHAVLSGKLGPVSIVNCDFYKAPHFGGFRDEMPSPLVADMAIHHFDLARFFTGTDPVAVYAKEFNPRGSWFRGDAAAVCVFEMTDGIIFSFRGCWCAQGHETSWNGNWRIVGVKGTLLYENDQPPRAQVEAERKGFTWPVKDVEIPTAKMEHQAFHGALREMLAFLRTGQKPQTECHDNIKSFAMVCAALESSRKKRRVAVRW